MSGSPQAETTTVVVGAGSSGGVIAARLSEDESHRVVLVEAGPDFTTVDDLPAVLRDAENPSIEGYDWGHQSYWVEPAETRVIGHYPRGRVIGGGSSVNAAIAMRGTAEDFDGWAELGNPAWGWSSVLPYFVKLERDEDFGERDGHGDDGPVPIKRGTWSDLPDVLQALATGFEKSGHPQCEDLNAPDAIGFGLTPRNRVGEVKASSAVAYLAAARGRANLEIVPETEVTRVLLESGRAVGVEVDRGGATETIRADRVVLCGGAVNTPQILMLSGIGPADVLSRAGVEVAHDLPGVGRNFQDHPFVPLVFSVPGATDGRYGFRAQLKYSSGLPGTPASDVCISQGLIRTSSMNFDVADGVESAVMVNPILAKPHAAGWLEITSSDPRARPVIHLNFLGDESDVQRLADAVRLVLDIVGSGNVGDQVGELLVGPDVATAADDAALRTWMVANVSTAFHAAGTCRMGPDGDALAVVDEHLLVRGIENLYIGDASVMPTVTSAYTNLTCYAIGERLAEWLRNPSSKER